MTEVCITCDRLEDMLFGGLVVTITAARVEDGALFLEIKGQDVPPVPFVRVRKSVSTTTVFTPFEPFERERIQV